MQLGIWGPRRKIQAQSTANQLGQVLNTIKNNKDINLLKKALAYNLKHRKADVLGRLAGGVFTNYASTGGKLGNKNINVNVKRGISLSNFILASYGASIKSVASGFKESEHILQSILTGRSNGPIPYPNAGESSFSEEEKVMLENTQQAISEMTRLTEVSPAPVPLSEFCARPENIDIKELCK